MTTIVKAKMTLENFFNYEDGTDYLYELQEGELIEMPVESETNRRIISFLFGYLIRNNFADYRISTKTEIVVSGKSFNVRIPDLVVLSEDLAKSMEGATRSLITLDMPNPDLVVEVVSPNQYKRDYRYKKTEYCARQIPEYWIIDPMLAKVTVLTWIDGLYEEDVFMNDDLIASQLLANLQLRASQLLLGGVP